MRCETSNGNEHENSLHAFLHFQDQHSAAKRCRLTEWDNFLAIWVGLDSGAVSAQPVRMMMILLSGGR
jgi:hypothetical protein